MKTQNNKVVDSLTKRSEVLINEQDGAEYKTVARTAARRYAAVAILYMLGITFCVVGLVLNGNLVDASTITSEPMQSSGIDIGIWIAMGILTLGFLSFSLYFFFRKRRA